MFTPIGKPSRSLAELEALIPTWTAILPTDQPEESAIREFWERWEHFFPVDSNKQVSPEGLRAYLAERDLFAEAPVFRIVIRPEA